VFKPSYLWKATLTIHDGEFEYLDEIFIEGAKTQEDALAEARFQAQRWFSGDDGDLATPATNWGINTQDAWEDSNGYRIIELEGVRKIEGWLELLASLHVVDCKHK
jgi:hypothetical protein